MSSQICPFEVPIALDHKTKAYIYPFREILSFSNKLCPVFEVSGSSVFRFGLLFLVFTESVETSNLGVKLESEERGQKSASRGRRASFEPPFISDGRVENSRLFDKLGGGYRSRCSKSGFPRRESSYSREQWSNHSCQSSHLDRVSLACSRTLVLLHLILQVLNRESQNGSNTTQSFQSVPALMLTAQNPHFSTFFIPHTVD